jgi:phage tail sheath protein FI
MPVTPTYPGVYIQEVPSGTRTIIGVSTSVAAFVGYFTRGPMNTATRLLNPGDFQRIFGPLSPASEAGYAVQQFFANGGDYLWIVRTAGSDAANPLAAASVTILQQPVASGVQGVPVLGVAAANPGAWGNNLVFTIDYNTVAPGQFNLIVTETATNSGQTTVVATMTFRNLSMDPAQSNYAPAVVNSTSDTLVLLTDFNTPGTPNLPAPNGTVTAPLPAGFDFGSVAGQTMTASLGTTPVSTPVSIPAAAKPTSYTLAPILQLAMRKVPELATAIVTFSQVTQQVTVTVPGQPQPVTFQGGLAMTLGFGTTGNVPVYVMGAATGAEANPVTGSNGLLPGPDELVGSPLDRTGIYALEPVEVINILCIPDARDLAPTSAFYVWSNALTYAKERFAMLIVDMPTSITSLPAVQMWLQANASLADPNSVTYWPYPMVPDPLNGFRLRTIAPSGTLAGLWARTDDGPGVWVAPAGVDAVLVGAPQLTYTMNDAENGVLNPIGVNALRTFTNYGNVAWGARTMAGSDIRASEWKYIPVRRMALFLELSLLRSLQWVVFEPNGEVLWRQIVLNVTAFMNQFFLQGAFKGTTPAEAYFVACDATTTSPEDINRGIVNVVVAFAPLKPAEFVVITLMQLTATAVTA